MHKHQPPRFGDAQALQLAAGMRDHQYDSFEFESLRQLCVNLSRQLVEYQAENARLRKALGKANRRHGNPDAEA